MVNSWQRRPTRELPPEPTEARAAGPRSRCTPDLRAPVAGPRSEVPDRASEGSVGGRRGSRRASLLAAAGLALAVVGCGGADDGASSTTSGAGSTTAAATSTAASGSTTGGASAGAGTKRPAVGGEAPSGATAEGLLAWIAQNPEHAGLVVRPDRGGPTIELRPAVRFPLASVRKVLVVGTLWASGANPRSTVPRADVERLHVAGTDGGAHEQAELDAQRPTLRQLARAAISVSDNASADLLLRRVGAPAVDRWSRDHGLRRQDPILPVFGELAAWTSDPRWARRTPAERARRAIDLARTTPASRVRLPDLAAQRRLAAASVAGTPAEWSRLMQRLGRDGDRELVDTLDWPRRQSPDTAERFERYLTKGGSLPGVVTEAAYLRPTDGPGGAVALFLRDLPPAIEAQLSRSFAQQELGRRLVTEPAFAARARKLLAAAGR